MEKIGSTVRELSKEQKIEVITSVLKDFQNSGNANFLWIALPRKTADLGYISYDDYFDLGRVILSTLIPEILQIKPENKSEGDKWFGNVVNNQRDVIESNWKRRKTALRKLLKIIEND
jgi:hypothetical protein